MLNTTFTKIVSCKVPVQLAGMPGVGEVNSVRQAGDIVRDIMEEAASIIACVT